MEKTEKGRGDFADDVHPERSVDLGQYYQSSFNQLHLSKELHLQAQPLFYIQPIQVAEISSSATLNAYGAQSQRDNIGNEFQAEMYSFQNIPQAQPNTTFATNNSISNNQANQPPNNNNNGHVKELQMLRGIHNNSLQLVQANGYEESITNSSIAEERKNQQQFDGTYVFAQSQQVQSQQMNQNAFRLEMKAQKHIHSMTEKKIYQEKEKRRIIDQDALEQMDQDCMSECSPQLIPKFTYCVNMPQNLPREQSYEALRNANRQKYQYLISAAEQLNASPVVVNYKNFLTESYKLAQEKPEECAHLLMTLETQFDLILHVSKPSQEKEYSKMIRKEPDLHSEQDDQDVN